MGARIRRPTPRAGRTRRRGQVRGSRRRWRKVLTDPNAYDWPRIRRAWYSRARASDPRPTVFVTKSPPHLLVVDDLARYFPNPKFLFMVRNPYAVCEGICRNLKRRGLAPPDGSLPEAAARHVVACLRYQRRTSRPTAGAACSSPTKRCARSPNGWRRRRRPLVPELDDLNLRQRLRVREYNEMLTDINPRQLARREAGQIAAFNRVFRPQRNLLAHFGYEIMGARP